MYFTMTPDTILFQGTVYNLLLKPKEVSHVIKDWQSIKVCYCHHVGKDVGLEAQVVYPADVLPDQPPRVICASLLACFVCNLDGRPSCMWAGTNPAFDPFLE